jgi:hypothetical protein
MALDTLLREEIGKTPPGAAIIRNWSGWGEIEFQGSHPLTCSSKDNGESVEA